MPDRFTRVGGILREAVEAHVFPGAAIEVGRADGARFSSAYGTLTYDPDSADVTAETIYDLASLTKVIATATLAMRAVDDGRLSLDDAVSKWLRDWRGDDRADVTIRDLLAHSSGLSAYFPFFRNLSGRAEFQHAICSFPLEYAPRSQAIYSDLGFMLLGFILEDAAGRIGAGGRFDPSATLSAQFHRVATFLTSEPLTFNLPRPLRELAAPTEIDPWRGRLIKGEVHDENTWALGGAAGHAGLFGTASAVGRFAQAALRTIAGEPVLARPETMRAFIARTDVPGSSRALAWDTMLPTSSCGTRLSSSSIGHTGFTGTSLWIDWERDIYVVLLSNRVHPTRENNLLKSVRPAVHDAVVAGFESR